MDCGIGRRDGRNTDDTRYEYVMGVEWKRETEKERERGKLRDRGRKIYCM